MSNKKSTTNDNLRIDGRTYSSVEAEVMAVAFCLTKTALRPKAERDDARQAGTRKKRRSHMPQLDAWLDKQDLNQSNDALWQSLPREDETDGDVYRDDDKVVEKLRSGKEHDATSEGFNKRVTAARKRRSPVSN